MAGMPPGSFFLQKAVGSTADMPTEALEAALGTLRSGRVPLLGQIEVTRECSFRCPFCYARPLAGKRPMTTDRIIDLLGEVVEAGCVSLLLTGGEPLGHPDFARIYSHAARLGVVMYVETNAHSISDGTLNALEEFPPANVAASLYAATDAGYKAVTGHGAARRRVMENIDRLLSHRIAVSLRTPICKLNFGELEALLAFSAARGLSHSLNFHLFPRQDGEPVGRDTAFSVQELLSLQDSADLARTTRDRIRRFLGGLSRPAKTFCHDGVNAFYVNAYGELVFCTRRWEDVTATEQLGFRAAWELRGQRGLARRGEEWVCRQRDERGICHYWEETVTQ